MSNRRGPGPARPPEAGGALRSRAAAYAVLWLAGFSLRVTILSLPPVLPAVRDQYGLSNAAVTALTTLPVLLFAAAATLGSAVVARLGVRRAVVVGLAVTAAATVARSVPAESAGLFVSTFVMGVGIAAVQPAMPTLVQAWLPDAVGRATAVYVNGLLVSEALAASITLPVLVPALGGWEAALAVWALPVALAAVLVESFAPRARAASGAAWVPDWRSPLTRRLGLVQGAGSVAYFGANAALPLYLDALGRTELVGWSLAALNGAQLAASAVLAVLPLRVASGRAAMTAYGVAVGGAAAGLAVAPGAAVALSALVGLAAAFVFTVSLALPGTLAPPGEVARLSAGMLTIGYTLAFVVPLAGGALWDATGAPVVSLAPVVAAGLATAVVGGVRVRR